MYTPAQNKFEMSIRVQQSWWSHGESWWFKAIVFALFFCLFPLRNSCGYFADKFEEKFCKTWKEDVKKRISKNYEEP
jgi:hypothetical protein